jgi:uncharacterized protein YyaL (SSP411 family)
MTAVRIVCALGLLLGLGSACADPQLQGRGDSPAAPAPEATPPEEDIARARQQKRAAGFVWEEFSPATMQRARLAGKLVLLDCVATWCHWCHVMDDTTYTDPELGALIREQVVAMRVDVDSRPDIVTRYEAWGWPATIIFSPQGEELGKFRGYLTAERLREILHEAKTAQQPVAAVAHGTLVETPLPVAQLGWVGARLLHDLDGYYDPEEGGWGRTQKLPLGANVEVELLRAAHGDGAAMSRARKSLDKQRALLDPVWGGLYQYSVGGVWTRPHFEKRLPIQTDAIEAYARALVQTQDPTGPDRRDAERVVSYLHSFLRNREGLYLVSQDADLGGHEKGAPFVDGHVYYALDDTQRRALGIPRIDGHVYAYENGLAIAAVATLAQKLGADPEAAELLRAAQQAAERLTRSHVEPDGTVRHEAVATSTLRFVADAAALGRALTVLAAVPSQATARQTAERIAAAMWTRFFDAKSGLLWVSTVDPAASGVFARREHSFAHNTLAARFLAALAKLPGVRPAQSTVYRARARSLLAALATPGQLADQGRMLGEYVLALDEVGALPWESAPYQHVTAR